MWRREEFWEGELVGLREVGVRAGGRATYSTCPPEAAVAASSSSSSGSDDRAVRQLRHPPASVITLFPPVSPEFVGLLSAAATASWWDVAAFTALSVMMICGYNSSRLCRSLLYEFFVSIANS